MTRKICLKQYVDRPTDCFRYHGNNYKCNDRKYARGEVCLQEHLFEHFNSEGHNGFLHDVSVTLINRTDGKILLNENTTGDLPPKRWHLLVLMLKMISELQFPCIYILLAPSTCGFLSVVAVVAVIIVPYDE